MSKIITNIDVIIINGNELGVDELVDSNIASKVLGLSPRTVRDMGIKRVIPVYRIGSRTNRFLVSDLLEFCESRRREKLFKN